LRSKQASSSGGTEEEKPLSDREAREMIFSAEEQDILLAFTSCLDREKLDASIIDDLEFWSLACLRARRYRLRRAIDLLENYSQLRAELRQERELAEKVSGLLSAGILTFLGGDKPDVRGRGIIMISLAKHDPKVYSARVFLHSLHSIVEHAIRTEPRFQVTGFVLINNMTGASMANFDTRIPREISGSISSRLPLRYTNLFIVNPPMFFAAVFRVVSVFLNSKMRARMRQLRVSENDNPLLEFIPEAHLVSQLGGGNEVDFDLVATSAGRCDFGQTVRICEKF
jgi:hypothetical protein